MPIALTDKAALTVGGKVTWKEADWLVPAASLPATSTWQLAAINASGQASVYGSVRSWVTPCGFLQWFTDTRTIRYNVEVDGCGVRAEGARQSERSRLRLRLRLRHASSHLPSNRADTFVYASVCCAVHLHARVQDSWTYTATRTDGPAMNGTGQVTIVAAVGESWLCLVQQTEVENHRNSSSFTRVCCSVGVHAL